MTSDCFQFVNYDFSSSKPALGKDVRRLIASHAASRGSQKRPAPPRAQSSGLVDHSLRICDVTTKHRAKPRRRSLVTDNSSPASSLESPVTIIGKGNSDPFSAFPVTINARVNRLICFGRDCIDPALRSGGPRGFAPLISGTNVFSHYQSLTDTCAGYMVLSYYASCMAVVCSEAECTAESLVLRNRGSEILRRQIVENDLLSSPVGARLIYRIYRAEVLDNNVKGALVHGRMLQRIFTTQTSEIDLALLTLVLYQENTLCAAHFVRPAFNETWVKQAFALSWVQARAMTNIDDDQFAAQVDPSVLDVCLREIFYDIQIFYYITAIATELGVPSGISSWYWFVSQCEWLQMRLMKWYHDIREDEHHLLARTNISLVVQSCLCLAALYTLRNLKNNPIIHGKPLYRSSIAIYYELEKGYGLIQTLGHTADPSRHSDAILWILYVLAIAENDLGARSTLKSHKTQLADHARNDRIRTWKQACAVFERFPFSKRDLPMPNDRWFDELVQFETIVHGSQNATG